MLNAVSGRMSVVALRVILNCTALNLLQEAYCACSFDLQNSFFSTLSDVSVAGHDRHSQQPQGCGRHEPQGGAGNHHG